MSDIAKKNVRIIKEDEEKKESTSWKIVLNLIESISCHIKLY